MRVKGAFDLSVTEFDAERVIAEMPITDGIKNPFGTVHAGAMLWFADVAATVLVRGGGSVTEGMQDFPLAISLNANLPGNQSTGTFKALSTFVKKGKTVTVVHTVVLGANVKLIAAVTTSPVLSG